MDITTLVGVDEQWDKAFEDAIEEMDDYESYSFGELMNSFMRKALIKVGFPEELYDKPFSEFTEEELALTDQFIEDAMDNRMGIFRKE